MIKNMHNIMFIVYLEQVWLDVRISFFKFSSKLKPGANKKNYSHNHQSPSKLAWKSIADNH